MTSMRNVLSHVLFAIPCGYFVLFVVPASTLCFTVLLALDGTSKSASAASASSSSLLSWSSSSSSASSFGSSSNPTSLFLSHVLWVSWVSTRDHMPKWLKQPLMNFDEAVAKHDDVLLQEDEFEGMFFCDNDCSSVPDISYPSTKTRLTTRTTKTSSLSASVGSEGHFQASPHALSMKRQTRSELNQHAAFSVPYAVMDYLETRAKPREPGETSFSNLLESPPELQEIRHESEIRLSLSRPNRQRLSMTWFVDSTFFRHWFVGMLIWAVAVALLIYYWIRHVLWLQVRHAGDASSFLWWWDDGEDAGGEQRGIFVQLTSPLDRKRQQVLRQLQSYSLQLTPRTLGTHVGEISKAAAQDEDDDQSRQKWEIPLSGVPLELLIQETMEANAASSQTSATSTSRQRWHRQRTMDDSCVICLLPFAVNDTIVWSPNHNCIHVFHQSCITTWWFRRGNDLSEFAATCPCCRRDFLQQTSSTTTTTS